MKNRLIRDLSRLASSAYRQKYILCATKESYVLLEEILEDINFSLNWVISHSQIYDQSIINSLENLKKIMKVFAASSFHACNLPEQIRSLQPVITAAESLLVLMKIDVEKWDDIAFDKSI